MDNNKNTPLQEAKLSFEELKKFATNSALKELEKEVTKKVEKALNESINITIDDDGKATIEKGDKTVEIEDSENGKVEVEVEDNDTHESETEELGNEEELDEIIEVEETPQEVIPTNQETAPPATEQPAEIPQEEPAQNAQVETPELEENPTDIDTIAQKLAGDIIDLIKATQSNEENNDNNEVVIDDEEQSTSPETEQPQGTNNNVQPQPGELPPQAPQQEQPISEEINSDNKEEDEIFEINLNELEDDLEDTDIFEINLDNDSENLLDNEKLDEDNEYFEFDPDDEDSIKAMLSAVGDISREEDDWKENVDNAHVPELENEEELEEIKGVSKLITQKQNTLSRIPREGNLNENKNKKAHKESVKTDELLKENKRLKNSVKEMEDLLETYKHSFIELKKEFDNMQTFNAKLAYVNKIFAESNLSQKEKNQILETFETVKNDEEAEKLYYSLIKEGNFRKTSNINKNSLKAPTTNNVKPKNGPLFESAEMKRRKVLAGIVKSEEF